MVFSIPCTRQTIEFITYSTSDDQEKVFFAKLFNYLDIFYNQMALCWIWDLIPPFFLHSAREEQKFFVLTALGLNRCTFLSSVLLSPLGICTAATESVHFVHLLLFIKSVQRCLYVWYVTALHNDSHLFF